jgi:hypothetical protein
VAQAEAETCPRKQGPYTLRGAVKAIDEHPFDPVRRLVLERRTLKRPIRLGQGRGTGNLSVAQMPEHPATDNRGQIYLLPETVAVLLIGQEIRRQG